MTDRSDNATPPKIPAPKITQEMINLYDDYTHISLDRRAYMTKLTAIVGTTAAAATVTDMIAGNKAAAQIVKSDDTRVKGEMVKFPGESGEFGGYLCRPANATGKLPTVIVIHENRGLTGHIQDVTRRMALEGFLAFGPDFLLPYGGAPADEDKGREIHAKMDRARAVANGLASIKFLTAHASSNGKIGVTGFCWGGGMSNSLAVAGGASVLAAAPYYGAQPTTADIPKIKARMMLHYAQNDDNINKGIPAYEAALKAAGSRYELFTYDGTQHAFNNDGSAARYNKAAADLAWSRTIAMFKKELA
jgi:carboxymethylenebutenolidase